MQLSSVAIRVFLPTDIYQVNCPQFTVPDDIELTAKAGDYLGWHDPAITTEGAVSFTEGGAHGVCLTDGIAAPTVGTKVEGSSVGNREYGISVCYGEAVLFNASLWFLVMPHYLFVINEYTLRTYS